MKITLTGSLGHIGKPLTKILAANGHDITVISSAAGRQHEITALGAKAAIGNIADAGFLAQQFSGADAVYCMVPPGVHFSGAGDLQSGICNSFATAIRQSGVQRVVHLSSVGAHMAAGSGLIMMHHHMEQALKAIPGIALTHMRAVAFFYNLYAFIPVIKAEGRISANYGSSDLIPWVAPGDIAAAVARELETPSAGRKISYVASDVLTCSDIAAILGKAINMPQLQWELISDEDMRQRMLHAGLPEQIVQEITEMNAAMHAGTLQEDFFLHRPEVFGIEKMTDFAVDFAAAFYQNQQ